MSIYDSIIRENAQASSARVASAVGPSPEKAAKSIDLGIKSGLPPSVVFLNPEKTQDEAAQARNIQVVQGSPALQEYVLSNQLAASVSSDDFEALDRFATMASFYRDVQGRVRGSSATATLAGGEAEDRLERDQLLDQMTQGRRLVGPSLGPMEFDPSKETNIGPPIQTIVGAILKLPDTFLRTFLREMAARPLGEDFRGSPEMQRQLFTGPMGLFNEVTVGNLARTVDLFFRPFLAAGQAAGEAAGEARVTLEPGAGETEREQAARDIRALFDMTLMALGFHDIARPRPAPVVLPEVVVTPDGPKATLSPETTQAAIDSWAVEVLGTAVEASKTFERSKPMAEQFARQVLGDETISIPAEQVARVYAEEGVSPRVGDELLGFVPDLAARLADAERAGGDVTIPLADYLVHTTPETRARFTEDVRVAAERLTVREAVEADAARVAAEEVAKPEGEAAAKPVEGLAAIPDAMFARISGNVLEATARPSESGDVRMMITDEEFKAVKEADVKFVNEETRVISAVEAERILKERDRRTRPVEAPKAVEAGTAPTTVVGAVPEPPVAAETAKPVPLQETRAVLDKADAAITGEAAKAVEDFIALPVGAKAMADPPVGVMRAHAMEAIARGENEQAAAALEATFAPIREELRAIHGDTIKLYRVQETVAKEAGVTKGSVPDDQRAALSWTADRKFAESYAGAVRERALIPEQDIVALEVEFDRAGEVKIPSTSYTLKKGETYTDQITGKEVVSVEIHDPTVGGFVTDTDSVRAFVEDINAERAATAASNKEKIARIVEADIPLNSVLWATDRANQTEFIVKNDPSQPVYIDSTGKVVRTEVTKPITEAPTSPVVSTSAAAATSVGRARKELYLDPLFKDAESAGMTKDEFAIYSRKLEAQAKQAEFEYNLALQHEVQRREQARSAESVARHLPEATAAYDSRLPVRAETFLKTNGIKLQVPEGTPVARGLASKDGLDPDSISHALGYQSGDDLIRDLSLLHESRGGLEPAVHRKAAIAAEAERLAVQELGPLGPRINQAVTEGLYNDVITRNLHDDMRVMRRQNEGETAPPISLEELDAWAQRVFNETFDVKQGRSLKSADRAVAQAGRRAELALLKGKIAEAFKAKNQQLHAHRLGREVVKFQKEWKKAARTIKRFTRKTVKGVEQAYVDQIQGLLARHGVPVKRADLADALQDKPLQRFVREREDGFGAEMPVAEWLFDELHPKDIQDMSVGDFREFMDSIYTLQHNGRAEMQIRRGLEMMEREEFVAQVLENLSTLELPLRKRAKARGPAENTRHLRLEYDAWITRPEELLDAWDHGDPMGPLNQAILRVAREALATENQMFRASGDFLRTLPQVKEPNKRVSSPFIDPMSELPYDFNRIDVVMMALNLGNKRNRELLAHTLRGREIERRLPPERKELGVDVDDVTLTFERLSREKVREDLRAVADQEVVDWINSVLTAEDWQFVQGLWTFFSELKPQIDRMYQRLSGVSPDTVEATPVVTPHGTFAGGYSPIIYDPKITDVTVLNAFTPFQRDYHRATTPNRYTVSRQKGVWKDLQVQDVAGLLGLRIREMLHDLAFREAIINIAKVLRDPRIRTAINKFYGPEYTHTLDPWVQNMANRYNVEDKQQAFASKVMRWTRERLVVQALGLNLNVILSPNVGPLLREMFSNPAQIAYMMQNWSRFDALIRENSPFIRDRDFHIDRDIGETLSAQIGVGKEARIRAWGAKVGMYLPTKIDVILAKISWWGEYQRGLRNGLDHDAALFAAEKFVHKYFGSSSRVDLPLLFQSGEGYKQISLFGGYLNVIYNRTRDVVQVTKRGARRAKQGDWAGASRDFTKAFVDALTMYLVPAAFGYLYAPQMITEDWGGTVARGVLSQALSVLPFVREFAAGADWLVGTAFPPRPSPTVQMLKGVGDVLEDVTDLVIGEEPSSRWVQHALNVPGYLLGLPTGGPARAGQFLWNWTMGHDVPDTFWEFTRGVHRGATSEKADSRLRRGRRVPSGGDATAPRY